MGFRLWSCCFILAPCGTTDNEAAAISEAIVTSMETAEINREFKDSQDFDRIAEEAVAGMDPSGLEALTQ
ncbi:hypothetical protein [Dinoroseobacter sp. S76]|uniref:hypothetical protein n=1 Tax=Dinoroseobacter sp. S76 TaxID=3415124 RepID=UPI003C79E957